MALPDDADVDGVKCLFGVRVIEGRLGTKMNII